MFVGNHRHSIDNKGRVAIPSKMRKFLSPDAQQSFMVIRGINKCIDLFPMNVWQKITEDIKALGHYNEEDNDFLRQYLSNATLETMDAQSRIPIPKVLLDHAGINKEVVIAGMMDKIEIWSAEEYDRKMNQSTDSFAEVAQKVMNKKPD